MFVSQDDALSWHYDGEHLQIKPWGPDAFRVRSTKLPEMPPQNWALSEPVEQHTPEISLPSTQPTLIAPDQSMHGTKKDYSTASITNGLLQAQITAYGKLTMRNTSTGKQIFEEYNRTKIDHTDPKTSAIQVQSREFGAHGTGATEYHIIYRIEPQSTGEKIYGMGQYQSSFLNLKGLDIELAQRNSQSSVPFFVSSLGYGILWNNPSIGRAVFGRNITSFEANSTSALDFWIVTGPTLREILHRYVDVTGHSPMMPEYGLGFWQCKLRYKNQEELLTVAREYKKRQIPLDVIVADYFHWSTQGDWAWDRTAWPDPKAMVDELAKMNVKLLVSVWPTVDKRSEAYNEMLERGLLVRVDRGIHTTRDFMGQNLQADFTNPATRKYVWDKIKKNYHDIGVKCFWLDEAEPEYNAYAFENYRYYLGPVMSVGNLYPRCYTQAFYEGQLAAGQLTGGKDGIVNLVRCAWAGSQKYGALIWSGDTASSWTAFRNQLAAGLNMGLSGIPWWTTDIGGFYGGETASSEFRELLVRWFQWGTFCPVMRLHGCREPVYTPQNGEGGLAACDSGADNELWSFGEENYPILLKFVRLRERLREYIRQLMEEASNCGTPVIRTMFFEFPEDKKCWEVETQYMFGHKYLCAPIMEAGQTEREVYLPKGSRWGRLIVGHNEHTVEGEVEGGSNVTAAAPIDTIPIFVRFYQVH
ncbi:31 glucosidase [Penicillium crustosum]|uniref:31 glucosidase n=1 Tax=Penicillium crustosum TaxID=36656 RepID=UPI0023A15FE8|nr:31 glucosidase [Penicillium crustosum]KAJ5419462.1 31 glucosidase [Penicillium crustosum]